MENRQILKPILPLAEQLSKLDVLKQLEGMYNAERLKRIIVEMPTKKWGCRNLSCSPENKNGQGSISLAI